MPFKYRFHCVAYFCRYLDNSSTRCGIDRRTNRCQVRVALHARPDLLSPRETDRADATPAKCDRRWDVRGPVVADRHTWD